MDFEKIIMEKEEADWLYALKNLSEYLYEYYGKNVIILIDEYDAPIINAFNNGYYNEEYGNQAGTGTFSLKIKQKKEKVKEVTIEGGYQATEEV